MVDRPDGFATGCVIAGTAVSAMMRPATHGHLKKGCVGSFLVYFRL
jgi:hypothetical protein